jgi:hypothetical protein
MMISKTNKRRVIDKKPHRCWIWMWWFMHRFGR